MPVIRCTCGEEYRADDAHVGRSIRCRKCGRIHQILPPPVEVHHSQPPRSATDRAESPSRQKPARETWRALSGWIVAATIAAFAVAGFLWRDGQGGMVTPEASIPVSSSSASDNQGNPFLPATESDNCTGGGARRPSSNEDLGGDFRRGKGEFEISNGTSYDAVAVLMDARTRHPGRAIYIRRGEKGRMIGIPVGSYRLQFQLGAAWTSGKRFCYPVSKSEFDRTFDFDEHRLSDRLEYWEWSVTLNGVIGGTATAHRVSDDAFVMP